MICSPLHVYGGALSAALSTLHAPCIYLAVLAVLMDGGYLSLLLPTHPIILSAVLRGIHSLGTRVVLLVRVSCAGMSTCKMRTGTLPSTIPEMYWGI